MGDKVPGLEAQSSALGAWEEGGESDLLPCEQAVGTGRCGCSRGGAPSCRLDPGAPRVLKVGWACEMWGHLQEAHQVATISISPHRAPKTLSLEDGLLKLIVLKGKVIPGKTTVVDSSISVKLLK